MKEEYQVSFDRFLEFPKEEAYYIYNDEKNYKIFRISLYFLNASFLFAFLIQIIDNKGFYLSSLLTSLCLIVLILIRIYYNKFFNPQKIRRNLIVFLISLFFIIIINNLAGDTYSPKDTESKDTTENVREKEGVIIIRDGENNDKSYSGWLVLFLLYILFLKLTRTEIIQLYSVGIGVTFLAEIAFSDSFSDSKYITNSIVVILFLMLEVTIESKRKKKFFLRYDYYEKHYFESLRMKKELNYAREMQLSMLPPSSATIGDIEISATSIPAYEVGGDFFDYFKIDDEKIGIFICDVSGHGVASALMLSGLRSCMHLILEDTTDPLEIFNKLNRMIRRTQNKKMFVTAIFTVIDTVSSKCTLFNAGHLPPYKISGDSLELFKIKKHGIALGALENYKNNRSDDEVVFDFVKNDKLIFYTDGISEAMNSSKEEYGYDKLEKFLYNNLDKRPQELLNNLVADINKFTQETPQKDDITVLIIGRN